MFLLYMVITVISYNLGRNCWDTSPYIASIILNFSWNATMKPCTPFQCCIIGLNVHCEQKSCRQHWKGEWGVPRSFVQNCSAYHIKIERDGYHLCIFAFWFIYCTCCYWGTVAEQKVLEENSDYIIKTDCMHVLHSMKGAYYWSSGHNMIPCYCKLCFLSFGNFSALSSSNLSNLERSYTNTILVSNLITILVTTLEQLACMFVMLLYFWTIVFW